MDKSFVLSNALRSTAIIHQSHSLKAYLSACQLADILPDFNDKGWHKCAELTDHAELTTSGLFCGHLEDRDWSQAQIDWILSKGLFPASYMAMKRWFEHTSMDDIFHFYERQAMKGNEYLLHTVSILLAFKKIWPELNAQQIPYALERFTEFVTSSYYGKNHIEYPLSLNCALDHLTLDNVISAVLKQPGFWGHNLLSLSWLLQCNDLVSEEFYHTVLGFIFQQCHWEYTDAEDSLDHARYDPLVGYADNELFYEEINHLILDTKRNIHQITLAGALVDMWERVDCDTQKVTIYKICCYFSIAP